MIRRPPRSTLFPYTTPSDLIEVQDEGSQLAALFSAAKPGEQVIDLCAGAGGKTLALAAMTQGKGRRSEEHTPELQSRSDLVCRLLLEKNNRTDYRLSTGVVA